MDDDQVEFGPSGVAARLAARWRVLVVFALLGAVIAGGRLLMGGVDHTATSQVLIGQPLTLQALTSANAGGVDQARLVDYSRRVIEGGAVSPRVHKRLGIDPDDYALSVIAASATNVIGIRATTDDPQQAQEIANAYAKSYIAWISASNTDRAARAVEQLEGEIAAIDRDLAALNRRPEMVAQRAALVQQRTALDARRSQAALVGAVDPAGGAEVVQPAREASSSIVGIVGPLILGALFGALVGAGVAAVRGLRSERSRRTASAGSAEPAVA